VHFICKKIEDPDTRLFEEVGDLNKKSVLSMVKSIKASFGLVWA
jgi:hypothetical protein